MTGNVDASREISMTAKDQLANEQAENQSSAFAPTLQADDHCPVCGAVLSHEKCKVVCRSSKCVYRIVFNCSEF